MAVADRCTVLRKGKYIGTVDVAHTTKEELSKMMVGRDVDFVVHKEAAKPGDVVLDVEGLTVASKVHKQQRREGRLLPGPGRGDRLYRRHRRQRPERAGVRPDRSGAGCGGHDHLQGPGHHPRPHPQAVGHRA